MALSAKTANGIKYPISSDILDIGHFKEMAESIDDAILPTFKTFLEASGLMTSTSHIGLCMVSSSAIDAPFKAIADWIVLNTPGPTMVQYAFSPQGQSDSESDIARTEQAIIYYRSGTYQELSWSEWTALLRSEDIVDNYMGGADKVLSAEKGKELKGLIDKIEGIKSFDTPFAPVGDEPPIQDKTLQGIYLFSVSGTEARNGLLFAPGQTITQTGCQFCLYNDKLWIGLIRPASTKIAWSQYGMSESEVLTKTNTTEFTPTGDYQPATKKYVDDASGSSIAKWTDVTLGTAISGIKEGLCKFNIKGSAIFGLYNPVHGLLTDTYVPIQRSLGKLNVKDKSGKIVQSLSIDLFGQPAHATRGFAEARDELTELYYKRAWSKDFMLAETQNWSEPVTTPTGNYLYTVTIPSASFADELPKKTGIINVLSPMAAGRPYDGATLSNGTAASDQLSNIAVIDSSSYCRAYMGMKYVQDTDCYEIYILVAKGIKKWQLLNSVLYIKYELENPIYDYHFSKIYAKNGYTFEFNQDTPNFPIGTLQPTNSNPMKANVVPTISIQTPANNSAVIEGFEQTATNINDLNNRVDNIEVSSAKLGVADGVTDDSDAIQNAIDKAQNTSGHVAVVKIPDGEYALGKPLELNRANLKLLGDGNVILRPTGNFPAIRITRPLADTIVSDITVENIKIYLPNQVYMDGDYPGSHSGIYIDPTNGIYRVSVINVEIQGIYRFRVADTDRSYGIYVRSNLDGSGLNILSFPKFESVRAFAVYCGIYVDKGASACSITDFYFDHGNDIYGLGGVEFTTVGLAYGIIFNSNFSDIDFRGQFVGGTIGGYLYQDYDDNKYSLAEVIGAENVATDTRGRDCFVEGYDVQQETTIVKNGVVINVFLKTYCLTKAAVMCGGKYNNIRGFSYDMQRSESYYYFTNSAYGNRYYLPTGYYINGNNHCWITEDVDYYDNGSSNSFTYNYEFIHDYGHENKCLDPVLSQNEDFFGEGSVYTYDDELIRRNFPKHFGIQDDALAYADQFSTISVYQQNTSGTKTNVTVNGVIANSLMKEIFDPKATTYGFVRGITFDQIPTPEKPIYIDIEFNNGMTIGRLGRFGIHFNDCIARDIKVIWKINNVWSGSAYMSGSSTRCNQTSHFTFTTSHTNQDKTQDAFINNVQGIRIILSKGYSTTAFNKDGKVGLTKIWCTDGIHGGNAWLPRGGGDVYGNIDMNNKTIKSIATPTEDTDSANKKYVDDLSVSGITLNKDSTGTITDGNLTLSNGTVIPITINVK